MGTKLTTGTGRKVALANPSDSDWTRSRYVFAFGAYGDTLVMAWGSLDDALEAAADWIEEHAPGIFHDDAVREEYELARAEGLSEEKAQERAEQDMTSVCSGNHYIPSWEWTIVFENPDRATLKRFLAGE
jgi:asparagine synthetase A